MSGKDGQDTPRLPRPRRGKDSYWMALAKERLSGPFYLVVTCS